MLGVLGQNFESPQSEDLVGVVVGPLAEEPNVYANNSHNLKAAIRKRITEKVRPNVATSDDVAKVTKVVQQALSCSKSRGVFSVARIQRWAETKLCLEDIKSGKWSSDRFEKSLDHLFTKAEVKFDLKAAVKLEPMPQGKAPRMLIADGDAGQLMALVSVRCFEDLLFEWMEARSIKHAPRQDAIKRVIGNLKNDKACAIEGDGSAWDTTCNEKVRAKIENPILSRIVRELLQYGVVPASWHQAHLDINAAAKLKLFFSKNKDVYYTKIDAIRRSGHRGTSCLNWWINYVMWTSSIFQEPERFLDPEVRKGNDVTGCKRWWAGAFEGDDSLCTLYPKMEEGDILSKKFLTWWERWGFNMKIVFCTTRATFVGTHIACEEGRLTDVFCPELPRCFKGAGVSVSTAVRQAFKDGDVQQVKNLGAAAMLARAADFAGILPTVSEKFLRYAESIKDRRNHTDREMSMAVMGVEGHTTEDIVERVTSQNVGITPSTERATMTALGYGVSDQELDIFSTYVWDWATIGDVGGFRDSLPLSWR